jgi:Domain of unknown function (DUF1905)/Bacteriocin-protection, YdeI or OmpD-Associated
MKSFSAKIAKIGINPYVSLPEEVLESIFEQAGKAKGPIPVRGTVNRQAFTQTLVQYQGAWRLYINGVMREAAGIDVGDEAHIRLEFDPTTRMEPMHPRLEAMLARNKTAKTAFEKLIPSRQKEILRYLNSMKTEESLDRNIERIIKHLLGEKTDGLRHITSRSK